MAWGRKAFITYLSAQRSRIPIQSHSSGPNRHGDATGTKSKEHTNRTTLPFPTRPGAAYPQVVCRQSKIYVPCLNLRSMYQLKTRRQTYPRATLTTVKMLVIQKLSQSDGDGNPKSGGITNCHVKYATTYPVAVLAMLSINEPLRVCIRSTGKMQQDLEQILAVKKYVRGKLIHHVPPFGFAIREQDPSGFALSSPPTKF